MHFSYNALNQFNVNALDVKNIEPLDYSTHTSKQTYFMIFPFIYFSRFNETKFQVIIED